MDDPVDKGLARLAAVAMPPALDRLETRLREDEQLVKWNRLPDPVCSWKEGAEWERGGLYNRFSAFLGLISSYLRHAAGATRSGRRRGGCPAHEGSVAAAG